MVEALPIILSYVNHCWMASIFSFPRKKMGRKERKSLFPPEKKERYVLGRGEEELCLDDSVLDAIH